MERQDEGENVVRKSLSITIRGVESVGSVRSRHNPLVVGLVKSLVNQGVVKSSMDPVDAEIGKHQEQRELKYQVPPSISRDIHVEH